MSYDKMTPASFLEKLKGGEYSGSTGAKRALGRSGFSDKDKSKCLKALNDYYDLDGDGSSTSGKKAAKKAAKKGGKKKAAKVAKKAAKKVAAKKKGSKKKAAANRKAAAKRGAAKRAASKAAPAGISEKMSSLKLNRERIGTIDQAVSVMQRAKEAHPQVDLSEGATKVNEMLTEILKQMAADQGLDQEPEHDGSNGVHVSTPYVPPVVNAPAPVAAAAQADSDQAPELPPAAES